MSYDISLLDPVTKKTIQLDSPHQIKGGTYAFGGTQEAWLNITYNYSTFFYKYIDEEKGIRFIYGKTGSEAIPILKEAISKMGDDVDEDYWKPTEGNTKRALHGLIALATLRPDGIFEGD